MKRLLVLLVFWGGWGFSLGTLVLLGPLRWTVNWGRSQHWTEGQEKIRVLVLIVLLAVVSFLAAKASAAALWKKEKSTLHFAWLLLPLLGSVFSVYAFMHPTWMGSGSDEPVGGRVIIGPYPEAAKLKALKQQGYQTVISLLHPAVVPFEPRLMKEEQQAAKAIGLTVVSIPMLPWVSDNAAALDSLRRVIRNTSGKLYIHCYLGKDRVNLARRIAAQETGDTTANGQPLRHRLLDTVQTLERGPVFKLEDGVFFTPFPTPEEYTGYVLAANYRQVVSLVDLQEPGAKELMEEEKKALAQMGIAFTAFPFSAQTTAEEMRRMVADIKALPKPRVIHPFFSAVPEARLFRQLYTEN